MTTLDVLFEKFKVWYPEFSGMNTVLAMMVFADVAILYGFRNEDEVEDFVFAKRDSLCLN